MVKRDARLGSRLRLVALDSTAALLDPAMADVLSLSDVDWVPITDPNKVPSVPSTPLPPEQIFEMTATPFMSRLMRDFSLTDIQAARVVGCVAHYSRGFEPLPSYTLQRSMTTSPVVGTVATNFRNSALIKDWNPAPLTRVWISQA
jgi:hypothetical protein